jgi:hypothetical protein
MIRLSMLLLAVGWATAKQDCPVNVRDGYYCDKCKKALKEDELLEKEYCKICGQGQKVEAARCARVKVCDQTWVPKCGMHDMKPHRKPCCKSTMCCKIDHDLALVEFKCSACGAQARTESGLKHHCKDAKLVPVCTKSGTFPHGGPDPD